MKTIFLFLLFFLFTTTIFCQNEVIHLKNPSFEDYPRAERVPVGWRDCGFSGESAPDTHPSGAFGVIQAPADGTSYLGLVTRDNDTWESVGQKLSKPLTGGQCYAFKINLSRSEDYVSLSRTTKDRVNYTQPIKLVFWGGYSLCEKKEKLGESPLIGHTQWKEYLFTFRPENDYAYLRLEALYKQPVLLPYNGNIIIDKAFPLVAVACDSLINWTRSDFKNLFENTETVQITIEASDIDASQNNLTDRTPRVYDGPTTPAIYYNASMSKVEREKKLQSVVKFLNNNPFSKAKIIIKAPTKVERKLQKQKFFTDLKNLGIPKSQCKITLLKK